eukprot:CAMPEP_0203682094 /NCGR_PEP_ID=MMETSP0090-20130426/44691_1 /ASSEMBLY_ACC=CAM_ASM_001088 /TAXON_ID=426623 /ORGANISM="Chaetoceros affinis, Strain CCMP159" /LENGTH=594 /DNA_ID=CAMNT_0050550867 /DNA_START=241 /DNA_END=2025 /DNA_ORIENTATION=+
MMAPQRLPPSLLLLLLLLSTSLQKAVSKSNQKSQTHSSYSTTNSLDPNLQYITYPLREESKAAIVEWGNSAIISALDAAVADFGVPTSHSAFFEVETSPILADPVDGRGGKPFINTDTDTDEEYNVPYPGPLDNADEVRGNLLVMTNQANMSGVTMARIAKESGAAALMVVNVDQETPDLIYSLSIENSDEQVYAENEIDFPVVMVSLASGNLITTATVEEGMEEEDIVNNGMPERIRLYAAGDRPFFEDVSSQSPVLYLIHNLMTEEECLTLIDQSKNKMELVVDTNANDNSNGNSNDGPLPNLLEYEVAEPSGSKSINIERTVVWKGQINSHAGKQVEERIEQVTGYPQDQFSDWIVTRHTVGSRHELHYDHHPIYPPVATITVFLNDLDNGEEGEDGENDNENDLGGEIVYPNPVEGAPVMIAPHRGLAVVHHNTDYDGNVDYAAVYGEMTLRGGKDKHQEMKTVKYIAKKYVYAQPLPPSKRLLLPLLAVLTGGKLPKWVIHVHNLCLSTFGLEKGTEYFDKLCTMFPVFVLFVIGAILQRIFQSKLSSLEHPPNGGSGTSNGSSNSGEGAKSKKSNGGKKKGKKNKKLE